MNFVLKIYYFCGDVLNCYCPEALPGLYSLIFVNIVRTENPKNNQNEIQSTAQNHWQPFLVGEEQFHWITLRYGVHRTDSGATNKGALQGHRIWVLPTINDVPLPPSTLGRIYRDVCHAMAQKSCRKYTFFFVWEDRPETCPHNASWPAEKRKFMFNFNIE